MRNGSESGDKTSAFGFAEPTARPEVGDQRCEDADGRIDQLGIGDSPSIDVVTQFSGGSARLSVSPSSVVCPPTLQVALLTGGDDRSYALGLTLSLVARGVIVDIVGSDRVDGPELRNSPKVNFLNLRGDQTESAGLLRKVVRLLMYYLRLIRYAVVAKPRVFHILWNNKFEWFDRTLLMAFYRLLGRKIAFTAHNVNAGKRDNRDSAFNRFTLRIQYRLVNHIFVHSQKMRGELCDDFGVPESKVSVIPFGINNTTPTTDMTREAARRRLGLHPVENVALFFGQIAPYKGLEFLVEALPELIRRNSNFRLIIAGKVKKGWEDYWARIEPKLAAPELKDHVIARIGHVPNEEVEVYFKATDVLLVPYTCISQSGVPFLAYSFGLPVIATDVGSLREDIIEGKTGFVCRPDDSSDLTKTILRYFEGELFRDLENRRLEIKQYANERYSWDKVSAITANVYSNFSRA
jgi:D-inositol-3-phosphate glycosyltransferase